MGWYAVALQVEDYISTNDSVPMSSVPIQFLVNIVEEVNGSLPVFVGDTPEDSTSINVAVGSTFKLRITARSGGEGSRYCITTCIQNLNHIPLN